MILRTNRFNGFEVLTLSACAFVLGASLTVLGCKRRVKGGVAVNEY